VIWIAVHEKNALIESKIDEKKGARNLKIVLTSKYEYFSEKKVYHNSILWFLHLFQENNFENKKKYFKNIFFWKNLKF